MEVAPAGRKASIDFITRFQASPHSGRICIARNDARPEGVRGICKPERMETKMRVLFLAVVAVFLVGLSHTAAVSAESVTFVVEVTGAEENPPVSGGGSATATFTFDEDTQELTFKVNVHGLSEGLVTASHIHRGAVGVNGPIVHPLSLEGFTVVSGSITLSDAEVADLKAGNFYVNVHSKASPGGFARGQMVLPSAPDKPAITPPDTGDGGLVGSAGVVSSWLPALTLAVAALSLAALATRRAA